MCRFVCSVLPRGRRALENRTNVDDEKIEQLEELVKGATECTNEAERKYEEVRACSLTTRIHGLVRILLGNYYWVFR